QAEEFHGSLVGSSAPDHPGGGDEGLLITLTSQYRRSQVSRVSITAPTVRRSPEGTPGRRCPGCSLRRILHQGAFHPTRLQDLEVLLEEGIILERGDPGTPRLRDWGIPGLRDDYHNRAVVQGHRSLSRDAVDRDGLDHRRGFGLAQEVREGRPFREV